MTTIRQTDLLKQPGPSTLPSAQQNVPTPDYMTPDYITPPRTNQEGGEDITWIVNDGCIVKLEKDAPAKIVIDEMLKLKKIRFTSSFPTRLRTLATIYAPKVRPS